MSRVSSFFHTHCFQFLWSASVPFGPISPLTPRGPGFPVMPFSPYPPRGPGGPVMPFSPLAPLDPAGPTTPISPLAPSRPSRPGNPFRPFRPLLQEVHSLHVDLKKAYIVVEVFWRVSRMVSDESLGRDETYVCKASHNYPFVRCVTLKWQTDNALEQGKRWVIVQVLAN